ncbi:hypothetical protein, partial [Thauera sp.]
CRSGASREPFITPTHAHRPNPSRLAPRLRNPVGARLASGDANGLNARSAFVCKGDTLSSSKKVSEFFTVRHGGRFIAVT